MSTPQARPDSPTRVGLKQSAHRHECIAARASSSGRVAGDLGPAREDLTRCASSLSPGENVDGSGDRGGSLMGAPPAQAPEQISAGAARKAADSHLLIDQFRPTYDVGSCTPTSSGRRLPSAT